VEGREPGGAALTMDPPTTEALRGAVQGFLDSPQGVETGSKDDVLDVIVASIRYVARAKAFPTRVAAETAGAFPPLRHPPTRLLEISTRGRRVPAAGSHQCRPLIR